MMQLREIAPQRRIKAIRVYKNGEVILTAPLVRYMKLQPGDRLKIFFCEKSHELYLTKNEKGIRLRKKNRSGQATSLRTFSKGYSDYLLKGEQKGLFRVGEVVENEEQLYYPIIYKKNYAN